MVFPDQIRSLTEDELATLLYAIHHAYNPTVEIDLLRLYSLRAEFLKEIVKWIDSNLKTEHKGIADSLKSKLCL